MASNTPDLEDTRTSDDARYEKGVAAAPNLGRYTLLAKVGEGGMGQVYSAYDPKLDRRVALKLLHGHSDGNERARLLREAKALAQVSHPNVLTVYEVHVIDERVVVALEYVSGRTLKRWAAEHGHAPEHTQPALDLLLQAGRGLSAAHARGLIHRDFKPSNVLVGDDGRVRVADFGLARPQLDVTVEVSKSGKETSARSANSAITQTGRTIGTPAYMAPEQFAGQTLDSRVDQFAFCITAWEVLTGARPFSGESFEELRAAAMSGEPARDDGTLSPPLLRALRKGLRPRPSARWSTLDALLSELEVELRRLRGESGTPRKRTRWKVVGATIGLAAVGFAGNRFVHERSLAACAAKASEIREFWRPEVEEDALRALGKTKIGTAVDFETKLVPLLGRQATHLEEAAMSACKAESINNSWTEDQARRAKWCLEDRRLELSTLVNAILTSDEKKAHAAIELANELEPVSQCLGVGTTLGTEPVPSDDALDSVRHVAKQISEAKALVEAGEYEEGVRAAKHARTASAELHWAPLGAEAELVIAEAQSLLGDTNASTESALSAFVSAVESTSWSLAASAADYLFWAAAESGSKTEQQLWQALATATARKTQMSPVLARALDRRRRAELAFQGEGADAATVLMEAALRDIESAAGANSLKAARFHGALAQYRLTGGDLERAEHDIATALEIQKSTYGEIHPELTRNYIAQGQVLARRGKAKEAAIAGDAWLDTLEKHDLATTAIRVALLYRTGDVWRAAGDYDKALARLEESRALSESMPTQSERQILEALGHVYAKFGRFDEAESSMRRALAIAERDFGRSHLLYAGAALSLSTVLVERGNLEEGVKYGLQSLSVHESRAPQISPELATTLTNVGSSLARLDRCAEAVPYLERASDTYATLFGKEHPLVARSHRDCSYCQAALGRTEEAISSARSALAIETATGANSNTAAASYGLLGRALLKSGQHDEALSSYRKCIEIRREALPPAHRSQGHCHLGVGEVLGATGKPGEALSELRRAESIWQTALGDEHPTTRKATRAIATLCEEQSFAPACAGKRTTGSAD